MARIDALRTLRILILVQSLVILLGCTAAHREIIQPTIRIPEFYSNKESKNGLTVVVDPYLVKGKAAYVFGRDLCSDGLYPIHLLLWNKGSRHFDFSGAEALLIGETGDKFSPLGADAALREIKGAFFDPKNIGYGVLGALGLVVTATCDGTAAIDSYIADRKAKPLEKGRYWAKNTIAPAQENDGFLLFPFGKDKKRAKYLFMQSFRFVLGNVRCVETGETITFDIPIKEKAEGEKKPSLW
ncbi:MAG: hypothetical protein PHE61_00680 [Candidatus Omnitrophica bacterium]|nr:hypothetical protein [Candidatus Omnitrophota bacterium]